MELLDLFKKEMKILVIIEVGIFDLLFYRISFLKGVDLVFDTVGGTELSRDSLRVMRLEQFVTLCLSVVSFHQLWF